MKRIVGLLAGIALPVSATLGEVGVVQVQFEYRVRLPGVFANNELEKSQGVVAERIAIACRNRPKVLPWSFTTQAAAERPRILVYLVEDSPAGRPSTKWEMQVEIHDRYGNLRPGQRALCKEVLAAGDLGVVVVPSAAMLPKSVVSWFEREYLAPGSGGQGEFECLLQLYLKQVVPVSDAIVLVEQGGGRAEGIVLLKYEVTHWARSRFLIVCVVPNGRLELQSQGQNCSGKATRDNLAVEGILVRHDHYNGEAFKPEHLPMLKSVVGASCLLEQYKESYSHVTGQ